MGEGVSQCVSKCVYESSEGERESVCVDEETHIAMFPEWLRDLG